MASFTVDPAVINQKATLLSQYADEYEAISNQLRQAATTMGAAYDSADNRSFVSRIEQCVNDLKNMAAKLRAASATLKGQSSMYTNTENANTQQANRLPG